MTIGRNDPCPCGSGLKYKKCCANKGPLSRHKFSVITGEKSLFDRIHKREKTEEKE